MDVNTEAYHSIVTLIVNICHFKRLYKSNIKRYYAMLQLNSTGKYILFDFHMLYNLKSRISRVHVRVLYLYLHTICFKACSVVIHPAKQIRYIACVFLQPALFSLINFSFQDILNIIFRSREPCRLQLWKPHKNKASRNRRYKSAEFCFQVYDIKVNVA